MSKIIYSAIQTPDGTIIESVDRHDYKTHKDANGKTYMIDGGHDYIRCHTHEDQVFLTVTMDDPHEKRREAFKWGSWGKSGEGPYVRIPLSELTDDHIDAILETQNQIKGTYVEELMLAEQEYRK